jgi:hypothetical protein
VSGKIADNTTVKDYYIFVYHREDASKVESRKVLYRRVGQQEASLDSEVPLFEGMNRIAVVARDDEQMSKQDDIYVYRK